MRANPGVIAEYGNVPYWPDGEPGEGAITKLDHVRGDPTVYVIDAKGKIPACRRRVTSSSE